MNSDRPGRVIAVIPVAGRPLLSVQKDLERMSRAFKDCHLRATRDGMGYEVVDLTGTPEGVRT